MYFEGYNFLCNILRATGSNSKCTTSNHLLAKHLLIECQYFWTQGSKKSSKVLKKQSLHNCFDILLLQKDNLTLETVCKQFIFNFFVEGTNE